MNEFDYEERIARADRAVTTADEDVRSALQVLSEGATPRLAQIGVVAVAVGVVGALFLRRGRRSNSRLSKAIDYTVLLPLAANIIPRIVAMIPGQQPIERRTAGAGSERAGARTS